MEWNEIADRVWVARLPWFDVNVSLVGGAHGIGVIDTHASLLAGRELAESARRFGPVMAVVNTHAHFDHCFGNGAFPGVPIHAHESAIEELAAFAAGRSAYPADPGDADAVAKARQIDATEIVVPDHSFSSVRILDLGDRQLELVHPGRGHTAGDLVVRIPDADVLIAGDLVEESAPPAYGEDSFPFEWPLSLDVVLSTTTPQTVVVPGHGAVVDQDFVRSQRAQIGVVAETIRDLAGRGVSVAKALESAQWPWPVEHLEAAVRRGYDHLPRSQKRLPLL